MDDSYLGMPWDILEYLMSLDSLLSFRQLYYTSTGPDCAAVHPGRLSTSQSPFLGELTTGANGELKTRTRSKLFVFFFVCLAALILRSPLCCRAPGEMHQAVAKKEIGGLVESVTVEIESSANIWKE